MHFAEISLITFLTTSAAFAVPFAELTGDSEPALLDQYLLLNISGNIGENAEANNLGNGYWTSASATDRTSSIATVYTSITFTATGLGASDSIDLSRVDFDYTQSNLNGSSPVMNVYLDTGDGYGASVLLVDDQPANNKVTGAHTITLNHSLKNGESITFGFSYADSHGSPARTHVIDNFKLEGTYDFDSGQAGIDLNNNGVSDIWEYRFGATDLVEDEASKSQDYDGDGFSNVQEALLGTNPFQARSRFELIAKPEGASDVQLTLATILGKEYQLYGSETLIDGSWSPTELPFAGTGGQVGFLVESDGPQQYFYQASVEDVDADGDRLTRWEELSVQGFSDDDGESAATDADDDYLQMKGIVQSALESSVGISVPQTTLYEDEVSGIAITFSRESTVGDDFLQLESSQSYQMIDTTEVASNAASSADYCLVDSNGDPLNDGVITLGVGETSKTVYVQPIEDDSLEIDEQLTLSVVGQSEINLWISDTREISSVDYIALSKAGHFLSQATMGGTPVEIIDLAKEIQSLGYLAACEAWIDEQMTLPRESTVTDDCMEHQAIYLLGDEDPSINIQNFELVWWGKVTQSKEQLRHRLAFTLSQIFVTSSSYWANSERKNVWQSYTRYYDKLMDHAFSNHRELLTTISYDPFMGVYLSSAQNRKANEELGTFPDENYAREVMQLFSCGVYAQDQSGNYILDDDGNRVENYDNSDIPEMAEVFTGLSLTTEAGEAVNYNSPKSNYGTRYENPMIMVETYHDTSEKILIDGTVLPANSPGDVDIAAALDSLGYHSSTAPHISRLLIKRLTSSNPSAEYLARVTEAWRGDGLYGTGQVGDFVAVFKAILLDAEARDAIDYQVDSETDLVTVEPNRAISGRIKEPILKWTQFYRFSQALSGEEDGLIRAKPKTKKAANDQTADFGQIPMRAQSVFNYYDSDYSPSVGALAEAEITYNTHLTSPESEILSPYVIKQFESFHEIVDKDAPSSTFSYGSSIGTVDFSINYSYLTYLYQKNTTVTGFIDDINLWLCNGQISDTLKGELATIADDNGGATRENFSKVLSILFNSSDFSVSY
ncbi:DUF1800 family protein [Rubritalea sp.]|uniref:DUF1800 family protein n=1 Tax=Rubritalea sp. TaxID=2109375 RepID=UPI003EF25270